MIFKLGVLLIGAYFSTASALPPCVCTREMTPVCGTDGKTYANPCLLNCAKTKNSDLAVAKVGRCENDVEERVCICTFEYKPVCGTDGRTYPNECSLRCEIPKTPKLDLKYTGECVKEAVKVAELPSSPSCACTREFKNVCGSDGITYTNPCLLNCASERSGRQIREDHAGPCDDFKVRVVEQPSQNSFPDCTCTRELKPVCGSNGVTYNNECLLRCAGRELSVERKGPC